MGLPYLKTQPEEAIKTIDDCIVKGYQIKDKICEKYYSDKTKVNEHIADWQKMSNDWTNETIARLEQVFVSQKELYNFRDSEPPFGATSEDVQFVGIVSRIKARLDKLNEYDAYIRNEFNVKIEVIGRDKIIQSGSDSNVEINN